MPTRAISAFALLLPLFYLHVVVRMVIGPLLPAIEQELSITHAAAAGLLLLGTMGFSGLMLASSLMTSRITHRTTLAIATVLNAIGTLLVAVAPSLPVLQAAALLQGAGAGLYFPSSYASIVAVAGSAREGRALSMHETAPAIAFLSAPLIVQALSGLSWRWSLAVPGAAMVLVILMLLGKGEVGRFRGRAPSFRGVTLLVWRPLFLVAALLMIAMAVAGNGSYQLLPLYLVSDHGWSMERVNLVIAASRITGVGLVLVAGLLIDRLGARVVLAAATSSVAAMTVAIGVLEGRALTAAVLLQPLLQQGFWPAALVAVGQLAPPRLRPMIISLTVPVVGLVGTGILPALWGVLADAGRFDLGFIIAGVFLAVVAILALAVGVGRGRGERRLRAAAPAGKLPPVNAA